MRTLKEATARSFQYETRADPEAHPKAYVAAHNLGRHLKSLRWRTPFQATCDAWKKDPTRFKADPHHHTLGPYTSEMDLLSDDCAMPKESAAWVMFPSRITVRKNRGCSSSTK